MGGGWGHVNDDGHGCWSRLCLTNEGINYEAGYKWMPHDPIKFTTPEKLAKTLNQAYLSDVAKQLKDDSLLDNIIKMNYGD